MADETTTLRRCIGSERFGIDAHEAPVEDFPRQPSQKDGLGRMCKVHWNQYTAGLARDAKARKAAEAPEPTIEPAQPAPEPADGSVAEPAEPDSPTEPERARKPKRPQTTRTPGAGAQGDAG